LSGAERLEGEKAWMRGGQKIVVDAALTSFFQGQKEIDIKNGIKQMVL